MTTDAVSVAWLPAPPDADDTTLAVIAEALVPMFVWTTIPVLRAVEQKLTAIERFFLEAALDLGDLTVEDIDELTSLPAEATRRIAGQLCAMGTLEPRSDGYVVSEGPAKAALDSEVLIEYHRGFLTFLFLPRTDDILAFEHRQGRPEPPPVHRLQPMGNAAVPAHMGTVTAHELLRERVHQRRVVNLPDDVVDVEQDDSAPIGDICPVYRCAGQLRSKADRITAPMKLYDGTDRQVPLNLTGADGIIQHWLHHCELLDRPAVARQALVEIGTADDAPAESEASVFERTGPVSWTCRLGAAEARAVTDKGRPLVTPAGLEIVARDAPGSTRTEVGLRFVPHNADAAALFAIDLATHIVVTGVPTGSPSIVEAIARACQAYRLNETAVDEQDVLDRLWRRGHHKLIYRLRQAEDFGYD